MGFTPTSFSISWAKSLRHHVRIAHGGGAVTRSDLHQPVAPVPSISTAATGKEAYNYTSESGTIQKATLENVFGSLGVSYVEEDASSETASSSKSTTAAADGTPWSFGYQVHERNLIWNDDLKLRLIKHIASEELHISEEEAETRLNQLAVLLPGLEKRLIAAAPKMIVRLVGSVGLVAQRVLTLKAIFPQADICEMIGNRLTLLLDDDLNEIEAASERLALLLPQINIDKFAEAFPVVLDVIDFEVALEDAKRIMPAVDITQLLRSNPHIILSLIKGKNLIPYDEFANPFS